MKTIMKKEYITPLTTDKLMEMECLLNAVSKFDTTDQDSYEIIPTSDDEYNSPFNSRGSGWGDETDVEW